MPISILELSRKPEGTTDTRALHFDTLEDVELTDPIDLDVEITVVSPQFFATHSTGKAKLVRQCDRCLDDYSYDMKLDFFTEFSDDESEDSDEAWPIDRNQIDLEPVLREQILLRLPIQSLCKPDCKGISNQIVTKK